MHKHPLRSIASYVMRLLRRDPEPEDPHVFVREPAPRRPSGLSSAAVLEQPSPPTLTRAYGRSRST